MHQSHTFTFTILLKFSASKTGCRICMEVNLVGALRAKAEHWNNNELYGSSSCPIILIPAPVSCVWVCCFQALQPGCFNLYCLARGHEADPQPWETGLLTLFCSLLWGCHIPLSNPRPASVFFSPLSGCNYIKESIRAQPSSTHISIPLHILALAFP